MYCFVGLGCYFFLSDSSRDALWQILRLFLTPNFLLVVFFFSVLTFYLWMREAAGLPPLSVPHPQVNPEPQAQRHAQVLTQILYVLSRCFIHQESISQYFNVDLNLPKPRIRQGP